MRLVAAHYSVPIILVSGDAAAAEEARFVAPNAEMVVVKESRGRFRSCSSSIQLLHVRCYERERTELLVGYQQ